MDGNSNENTNLEQQNNSNYISSKVCIDFFIQQVKIYITIPQQIIDRFLQTGTEEQKNQVQLTKNVNLLQNKYLIINKKFTITNDLKTVIINDLTYQIPEFFNKESIKNEDKKTWEMIFYQIFFDEINKNICKYKELYKINKNAKNEADNLSENLEQNT